MQYHKSRNRSCVSNTRCSCTTHSVLKNSRIRHWLCHLRAHGCNVGTRGTVILSPSRYILWLEETNNQTTINCCSNMCSKELTRDLALASMAWDDAPASSTEQHGGRWPPYGHRRQQCTIKCEMYILHLALKNMLDTSGSIKASVVVLFLSK